MQCVCVCVCPPPPPRPQGSPGTHVARQRGPVLKSTKKKECLCNANRNERSRDALCFIVKTWARHKTPEVVLNNGWRLAAIGGTWRLVVGGVYPGGSGQSSIQCPPCAPTTGGAPRVRCNCLCRWLPVLFVCHRMVVRCACTALCRLEQGDALQLEVKAMRRVACGGARGSTGERAWARPPSSGAMQGWSPGRELAAAGPGLCLVILGGGGGQIGPPGFWLTHPPTHIRKFFLRKKMKFIKGARTWRWILGTQTFFWPLTHPPTPV